MNMPPRIGYACLNLDTHPSSYKTCREKNLRPELHRELVAHNLDVLEKMIDYNIEHNVKLYRISSSLIPFGSSRLALSDWKAQQRRRFGELGEKIRAHNMRICVHPGQYTVINSPRRKVVEASFLDLEYHADILDLLGADSSGKIILHIGGVYRDKSSSAARFIANYERLSPRIKKRLVIENDDKMYTFEDVLAISQKTGAPLVFDNLHHAVHPSLPGLDERAILQKAAATWTERPKMHYSQQAKGKLAGAHSSTIDLSAFIRDFENAYRYFEIDIMFEVKDKNRSFQKADLFFNPSAQKIHAEWARYKYLVMSKSYADYSSVRKLFRNGALPAASDFYALIDRALEKPASPSNELNTFEHVWGYFKNRASEKEKASFFRKLDRFRETGEKPASLGRELLGLAQKYGEEYLLSSYFLAPYFS